ncbi:MAG: VOC family protein [Acidobacteriota bacterium]
MIEGIADVYYSVADMDRAVKFYRDVLGLSLIDSNEYWSSLSCGGVRIGLHWTEGGAVPQVPRDAHGAHAGATITFRVTDIEAEVTRLKRHDVRFLGAISRNPWGSLAAFEDPDGNVLKLMQP